MDFDEVLRLVGSPSWLDRTKTPSATVARPRNYPTAYREGSLKMALTTHPGLVNPTAAISVILGNARLWHSANLIST